MYLRYEDDINVVIMLKMKNSETDPCFSGRQSGSEVIVHLGYTKLHRLFYNIRQIT